MYVPQEVLSGSGQFSEGLLAAWGLVLVRMQQDGQLSVGPVHIFPEHQ